MRRTYISRYAAFSRSCACRASVSACSHAGHGHPLPQAHLLGPMANTIRCPTFITFASARSFLGGSIGFAHFLGSRGWMGRTGGGSGALHRRSDPAGEARHARSEPRHWRCRSVVAGHSHRAPLSGSGVKP